MTEQEREIQRERATEIEHGSTDPRIPPVGGRIGNTPVGRHVRCESPAPNLEGFRCMRERGHEGSHSLAILNTDRAYVWPRTVTMVDARNQSGIVRSAPLPLDTPETPDAST